VQVGLEKLTQLISLITSGHGKFALVLASTLALILMAALKWFWRVPKSLLISVSLIFCICAIFYGLLGHLLFKTNSNSIKQTILLFSTWVLISGSLLGTIYRLDRAGWLWYKLTGYDISWKENYSDLVDLPIDDFVNRHPLFKKDAQNSGKLILPKGDYIFKKTVIIPRGLTLTIEPGVVLRFGAGRSLISYGPIVARGTKQEPIYFIARNRWLKWGSLGIVRTGKSVFENVRFENSRWATVNDIEFWGGLSLIDTDVEIRNSQFLNMFGKDGVYVGRSLVLINGNLFRSTFKDCLDLDNGKGEISSNLFVNCGDEGIDLSENYDLNVFDNQILDPRGGRISADYKLDEIISVNTFGYSDDE
jgi:hypothetical protein